MGVLLAQYNLNLMFIFFIVLFEIYIQKLKSSKIRDHQNIRNT